MADRTETLLLLVDVNVRGANALRALDAELDASIAKQQRTCCRAREGAAPGLLSMAAESVSTCRAARSDYTVAKPSETWLCRCARRMPMTLPSPGAFCGAEAPGQRPISAGFQQDLSFRAEQQLLLASVDGSGFTGSPC